MAHKLDFCSLCYGSLGVDDEGIKCKRCGSSFDVDGNVVERRNAHIAQAAVCGTCNQAIVDDPLTGTSCACANRVAMSSLKPLYQPLSEMERYPIDPNRVIPKGVIGELVTMYGPHILYDKQDADAPETIKDANGDITLGLCKVCGRGEAELIEPCAPSDSLIVDWLQHMHNLHTQVEALYVVDGYRVALTWDGEPMHEFHGETLREAYSQAMAYRYDSSKRRFVGV